MDCLLIRHGIAVPPDEWEGEEDKRPLTSKGKKRVLRAAAGLATLECTPSHLFSSPLVRALETARLIQSVLCPSIKIETCDELTPDSTPERILAFLASLQPESIVACVGHEPLLGETAAFLLCGKALRNFPFKKAGASLIHLPGTLKPGHGILRWWLEPMQLRALGKGGT
jgi:phosphohistidine phosphatase